MYLKKIIFVVGYCLLFSLIGNSEPVDSFQHPAVDLMRAIERDTIRTSLASGECGGRDDKTSIHRSERLRIRFKSILYQINQPVQECPTTRSRVDMTGLLMKLHRITNFATNLGLSTRRTARRKCSNPTITRSRPRLLKLRKHLIDELSKLPTFIEVCVDECPDDPRKLSPGVCGCGNSDELDLDGDSIIDCVDPNPRLECESIKVIPGVLSEKAPCTAYSNDFEVEAIISMEPNLECPNLKFDPDKGVVTGKTFVPCSLAMSTTIGGVAATASVAVVIENEWLNLLPHSPEAPVGIPSSFAKLANGDYIIASSGGITRLDGQSYLVSGVYTPGSGFPVSDPAIVTANDTTWYAFGSQGISISSDQGNTWIQKRRFTQGDYPDIEDVGAFGNITAAHWINGDITALTNNSLISISAEGNLVQSTPLATLGIPSGGRLAVFDGSLYLVKPGTGGSVYKRESDTWQQVDLGFSTGTLQDYFIAGNLTLVGTTNGIYIKSPSGVINPRFATLFPTATSGITNISNTVTRLSSDGTSILAVTTTGNVSVVFRSNDAGATWALCNFPAVFDSEKIMATPLLITEGSHQIVGTRLAWSRSSDAGNTWELMGSSEDYYAGGNQGLLVSDSLYVNTTWGGGSYLTNTFGASWTKLLDNTKTNPYSKAHTWFSSPVSTGESVLLHYWLSSGIVSVPISSIGNDPVSYTFTNLVSPAALLVGGYPNVMRYKGSKIYAGTFSDGVAWTDSISNTWLQVKTTQGLPHNHVDGLEVFPEQDRILVATTSGMAVLNHQGQVVKTYTSANSNVKRAYYFARSNNTAIFLGEDLNSELKLYRTDDYGDTISDATPEFFSDLSSFVYMGSDDDILWLSVSDGDKRHAVYVSENLGSTWVRLGGNDFWLPHYPVSVYFEEARFLIGTNTGAYYLE